MTEDPVTGGQYDAPEDFTAWRRVHPLSPVLKSWLFLVAAVGVLLAQSQQAIQDVVRNFATGRAGGSQWLVDRPLVLLGILGGIAVLIALVALGNWLVWRMTGYQIDDSAIYLRKGILNRQLRKARLDRVQSIDIRQPLIPRLFGLASLKFDVAGGSDSSVDLEYLSRARAEELQDALLQRVRILQGRAPAGPGGHPAGRASLGSTQPDVTITPDETAPVADPAVSDASHPGTSPAGTLPAAGNPSAAGNSPAHRQQAAAARASAPGANLGSRLIAGVNSTTTGVTEDLGATLTDLLAPYRVHARADEHGRILRIPAHTVLLSGLLSTGTLVALVMVLIVLAGLAVLVALGSWEAIAGAVFAVIPVLGVMVGVVKKSMDEANFSVTVTQDGLAVTQGLTTTTRKIVPLDRIQAVRLSQSLLWRTTGWWRADYNIAGQAGEETTSSTLLPVGSLDQTLMMLGLVLPDPQVPGGVGGRALITQAMYPERASAADAVPGTADAVPRTADAVPGCADASAAEDLFRGQAPASRWLDPLTYRRNGWARTGSMLVIRAGRLDRTVVCVPHARVQSMRIAAGPLQRALGLASVELHSTAGPANPQVRHLAEDQATAFFFEHAETTRQARAVLDSHVPGPAEEDE